MINYTENFTEALLRELETDPTIDNELLLAGEDPPLTANEIRALVAALKHNTRVTHLELRWNEIGDEGAALLAQTTGIKSLDISESEIGDEGVKAFAYNTSIEHLDLSGNNIGDEGAKGLAQNRTIKSLIISNNPISLAGVKAIANMPSLECLSLWGIKLGAEGARLLAQSKSITSLHLSKNQLGDEGVCILAQSKTLALLAISTDSLGDIGAKALAQNNSLYSLSLSNTQLSLEGAKSFLANTTLIKLGIYGNKFTNTNLWDQVKAVNSQNKALIEPERKQLMQAIFLLVLSCYRNDPAPICQLPAELLIYLSSYLSFPCSKHGWYKRTSEEVARFMFEHSADYQRRLHLSLQAGKADALRLREEIPREPGLPSSYRFTFFYRIETLPEEPDSAMPPAKLPRLEL